MDFSSDFKKKTGTFQAFSAGMAELLGVSKRTVSSWETGENEPQPKMRRRIDEIFKSRGERPIEEPVLAIDRTIIIEALHSISKIECYLLNNIVLL